VIANDLSSVVHAHACSHNTEEEGGHEPDRCAGIPSDITTHGGADSNEELLRNSPQTASLEDDRRATGVTG
jgi:hypothetical protein